MNDAQKVCLGLLLVCLLLPVGIFGLLTRPELRNYRQAEIQENDDPEELQAPEHIHIAWTIIGYIILSLVLPIAVSAKNVTGGRILFFSMPILTFVPYAAFSLITVPIMLLMAVVISPLIALGLVVLMATALGGWLASL